STHVREGSRIGASRFGWHRRAPQPGAWREHGWRIGWGMATSVYPTHRSDASALARLHDDGTLVVETGSQDLGTGTYPILTQIAADARGPAPSVCSPSPGAVCALRAEPPRVAIGDPGSRLHQVPAESACVEDGRIFDSRVFGKGESFESLLTRQGRESVEKRAASAPGSETKRYAMYAFGAQFAEVRVDPELGVVRV